MNITDYTPELAQAHLMGGYVRNMPNDVYHARPEVSKSQLDLIARSPAHFAYSSPREQTRAMVMGSALHTALLEPERFAQEYMLLRDVKDRRASEYKQAVKVYGADNVLTGPEAVNVAGMQEAAYSNEIAGRLLRAAGEIELSGFALDPDTGCKCRHRFDKLIVDQGIAVDIKKTRDARPWAFSKSVHEYRYHVQRAYYAAQYEWITGEPLREFWFIAIEEQSPHSVMCYQLDDDALAIGRHLYMQDMAAYVECIDKNYWPGYVQDDTILSLPGWVLSQYESELEEGGIV